MFYFEWERKHSRLVFIFALVAVACIAIGMRVDFKSFLGNLLAELAGLCMTVVLAILVIDSVGNQRSSIVRAEKWSRYYRKVGVPLQSALIDLIREYLFLSGKVLTAEQAADQALARFRKGD